jgi:putative multiple sugar transport system permease protein
MFSSRETKHPSGAFEGSFGAKRSPFTLATNFLSRYSMAVALLTVIAVFAFSTDGILIRDQNISNLIVQNGYILILAIGMVMVIIGGHIDLSVGSVAGFSGAIVAILMMQFNLPWWQIGRAHV